MGQMETESQRGQQRERIREVFYVEQTGVKQGVQWHAGKSYLLESS